MMTGSPERSADGEALARARSRWRGDAEALGAMATVDRR